ncbi:CLUMA_CG001620, isoform A [Clunio marinus]|uniref:CLUMA_CG001620, isoform A n=1 Tax=Clunio marinus TaxID=568069 RepID=A0A1J1HIF4_9DIPT|nr:CLUMA_CG001620, isoform A [Clunio marinus]
MAEVAESIQMSELKSKELAEKYRNEGNIHFRVKDFYGALVLYNKSLCHAQNMEQLSLAYANRSAVYIEVKMFDECVENIRLAKENGYPMNKVIKLNEREKNCKNLINQTLRILADDPLSFFKLSLTANEKIPYVVNCLKCKFDDKYGRHVITTEDLKPGDIILIEEPFLKKLDDMNCYTRCANCLKTNKLNLIACEICSTTMYCSSKCQKNDELLHFLQCHLQTIERSGIAPLKMVLQAVQIAGSAEKLKELLKVGASQTVFDFDWRRQDLSHGENLLKVFASMNHVDTSPSKEEVEVLKGLLECLQFQRFNERWKIDGEHEFINKQVHEFSSIYNTNSYGPEFSTDSREERQSYLKQHYRFNCDCEACFKNFPQMENLIRFDPNFIFSKPHPMSVKVAKNEFKKSCNYIAQFVKNHPSFETVAMMCSIEYSLPQIAKLSFDDKDELRQQGNNHYKAGDLYGSLILYNKSICYALPGSEEISLAFGNRSVVYMKTENYEKCLENIYLARQTKYPIKKLIKLEEREKVCKAKMNEINHDLFANKGNEDPWNFFKLSHPPNDKIPFIVDCLKLKENEKFGRHIVTSLDLHPGDIVAIEEPFFKHFDNVECYNRCHHCMKTNKLSLIACENCISTMYCSNVCKMEAKLHHTFTCNIKNLSSANAFLLIEILIRAIEIAGSVEMLEEMFVKSAKKTIFDFDLCSHKSDYLKNLLIAILSLSTSICDSNTMTENQFKALFSMPIFDSINKQWNIRNEHKTLLKIFLKLAKIYTSNSYAMKEHVRSYNIELNMIRWNYDAKFGGGVFPFASLFNHSCDPNVMRVCVDNKLVFIVQKPVLSGQQLFVAYRGEFYFKSRKERQDSLFLTYAFKCDCEACVCDYPTKEHLKGVQNKTIEIPNCSATASKSATQNVIKCFNFIKDNINDHPCIETVSALNCIEHSLHQLSKVSFDLMGIK